MAAQLFYLPFRPAISASGLAIPGAQLFFYLTGSTTKESIFSNSALTVELTNPVEANSAGVWPNIYLDDTKVYRVVLKDSDGVTLSDADPYLPNVPDALTVDLQDIADQVAADALTAAQAAFAPPVSVSGTTRTLLLTDQNKALYFTNAAGCTLTIPPESSVAFGDGAFIEIHQKGSGAVTVVAGSGVNLTSLDNLVETAGQYAVVGLRKQEGDSWELFGALA